MNKSDKIIVFFYIILALSYFSYIVISNDGLENNPFQSVTPKKITDFTTSQLIDVKKEIIFNEMANIENFPNVFPQNVLNVKILNKTDNTIIAEEELSEAGIKLTLLVKHTISPYNEHIIEIIDGDAKGTTIIQSFEEVNSQTNLTTTIHLNVKGVLSLIAYLPESNFIHAINTVNSQFIDYSKYDIYEKKVDLLYLEILNRNADTDGLTHFSELLRNKQITENELRLTLLNSEERASLDMKPIDELSDDTKNIINDLYKKILLREADLEGLKYFGNLFEDGTTSDEIRTILLESEEGKSASLFNPVRDRIKTLYHTILNKTATDYEINYYHKIIDEGLMTIDDVQMELEQNKVHVDFKK